MHPQKKYNVLLFLESLIKWSRITLIDFISYKAEYVT